MSKRMEAKVAAGMSQSQKVFVRTHANGKTLECEMTLRDDRCHTCNAPVFWVRTPNGKALIVNADAEADVLVSHWLTCPQARQWRGCTNDDH